jgi:hypothetical protein
VAQRKSQVDDVGSSLLEFFSEEGRRVAVLHAFLDESGTHPETPVLSVAGFYGSGNQWRAFRKLWKPFSAGFHAKDSSSRFPQLCHAIERSKINGLLVTISKEKYRTYATSHLKTVAGNPYSTCALSCALKICETVSPRRVSFFIEQGQPNVDFVRSTLKGLIASDWKVASVAVVKKNDFIELHTADFVSHIASSRDSPWLNRLFDSDRLLHGHITEKDIAEVAPNITKLFHKSRAQRKAAKERTKAKV